MKLFWCEKTRAVRAVWMFEELGLNYERVRIDIRDPEAPRDPEFAKASPMGKVPAIADGEVRISESAAICLYLADRYSPGQLAPTVDDPQRGEFLYWMFFTPSIMEPAMGEKFSGAESNKFSHGWGDFDTMIKALEDGIAGKTWLMGDQFTAADVMVGMSAAFLRQFGALPPDSSLNGYIDRCEARPGMKTAEATDEA